MKKQLGLTVIELVVAMSIASMLAMGTSQVLFNSSASVERTRLNNEWQSMISILRRAVSNSQSCTELFQGETFSTAGLDRIVLSRIGKADYTLLNTAGVKNGFQATDIQIVRAPDSMPQPVTLSTGSFLLARVYLQIQAQLIIGTQEASSTLLSSGMTYQDSSKVSFLTYVNPSTFAIERCSGDSDSDLIYPSGIVVPFATSCPPGWSILSNTPGRILLGDPTSTPTNFPVSPANPGQFSSIALSSLTFSLSGTPTTSGNAPPHSHTVTSAHQHNFIYDNNHRHTIPSHTHSMPDAGIMNTYGGSTDGYVFHTANNNTENIQDNGLYNASVGQQVVTFTGGGSTSGSSGSGTTFSSVSFALPTGATFNHTHGEPPYFAVNFCRKD